jgi:hypothetical protein
LRKKTGNAVTEKEATASKIEEDARDRRDRGAEKDHHREEEKDLRNKGEKDLRSKEGKDHPREARENRGRNKAVLSNRAISKDPRDHRGRRTETQVEKVISILCQ